MASSCSKSLTVRSSSLVVQPFPGTCPASTEIVQRMKKLCLLTKSFGWLCFLHVLLAEDLHVEPQKRTAMLTTTSMLTLFKELKLDHECRNAAAVCGPEFQGYRPGASLALSASILAASQKKLLQNSSIHLTKPMFACSCVCL